MRSSTYNARAYKHDDSASKFPSHESIPRIFQMENMTPRESPSPEAPRSATPAEVELGDSKTEPNPLNSEIENEAPDPIKYRIEYLHEASGETSSFDGKESKLGAETEPPVLEYVDVHLTSEPLDQKGSGNNSEKRPHASSRGCSYIKILSPAVCEALRCVVDYSPDSSLSKEHIKIMEPFALFVFYENALTEHRERLERSDTSGRAPLCANRFAAKHVKIAQDFVKQNVEAKIEAERERHARGYATFDMLWLLYQPGIDLYNGSFLDDHYDPFVVSNLHFSLVDGATTRYKLELWLMGANSSYVGPALYDFYVDRFAGEKKITSLEAFPCEYLRFVEGMTEQGVEEIRKYFIEQGKKWYNLRRRPNHYSFDGINSGFPRRSFESYVMVDPVQYPIRNQKLKDIGITEQRQELLDTVESHSYPIKTCSCQWCKENIYAFAVTPRFRGYCLISPEKTSELTEHQYFLCSQEVEAFVFKTRQWEFLVVSGFKEAQFEDWLIERLVMKPEIKTLIKELIRVYVKDHGTQQTLPEQASFKEHRIYRGSKLKKKEMNWSADYIQGKGEGLTFLLHGKPGVGKTYTAECISHFTKRPLLTLTCSDIGVEPEDIEENLLKWFKIAEAWGAILLIDEADIYMEQRQVQDIKRNHLVAGFLRALEYFRGILFLTTNRVGTFDEAFLSRIHVQIYYPEFSDKDREKVWHTFFQKLEDDRDTTMRMQYAVQEYVISDEVRALKWNGREIRNAFQVAVALAQSQNSKDKDGRTLVRVDHIKATVQMSKEFKGYMKEVWKHNESDRAAMLGHRFDAFDTPKQTKGKEVSTKW